MLINRKEALLAIYSWKQRASRGVVVNAKSKEVYRQGGQGFGPGHGAFFNFFSIKIKKV